MIKIRGGLKGLIQQLAVMAQLFLVAQAVDMVGVRRASSSHDHDLSNAVINRYNENLEKLKDVLKTRDPFATTDSHLVNNIINNNKKGSYCHFKILNAHIIKKNKCKITSRWEC